MMRRAALFAVFRAEEARKLEVQQRIHVAVRHEHNVAAAPAVASVRPAAGNELFPVEAGAAVSAIARLYNNSCLINELHRFSPFSFDYLYTPSSMA